MTKQLYHIAINSFIVYAHCNLLTIRFSKIIKIKYNYISKVDLFVYVVDISGLLQSSNYFIIR